MGTIGNASLLKDINKTLILNLLREHQPISRTDLCKISKLGLPTVLRNINHLLETGIVVEIGKGDTSSGRKPTLLIINPSAGYYLGVNVGRKLTLIMTDFNGHIVDQCIDYSKTNDGPTGIVKKIREMVFQIIEKNSVPIDKIFGLGVATPGSGFKNNSLITTYGYAGWENADFNQMLHEYIPEISTLAEFITICGAIRERWFGLGKTSNKYIYIYVDSGVGGGIVIDGQVYKGEHGFAGHIGHHVVHFEGNLCYCGNKGCLETYTSTVSLLKRIQQRLIQNEPSILHDRIQDLDDLNFNMVVDAYQQEDPLVLEEIRRAGQIMGIGLANAVNMYDPEMVILGGEMCDSCPLFVEESIKIAQANIFSLKSKEVNVVVSDIVKLPEALGAIALMMDEFYKNPMV